MSFSIVGKKRKLASVLDAFAEEDEEEAFPECAQSSSDVELLKAQGSILADKGDFPGALRQWDHALRLRPQDAELYELKAQVYIELGNVWPAIQSASQAVKLRPAWAEAHLTLGRAQVNFGEPHMALQSYEAALSLKPALEVDQAEVREVRQLALQHTSTATAGGARAQVTARKQTSRMAPEEPVLASETTAPTLEGNLGLGIDRAEVAGSRGSADAGTAAADIGAGADGIADDACCAVDSSTWAADIGPGAEAIAADGSGVMASTTSAADSKAIAADGSAAVDSTTGAVDIRRGPEAARVGQGDVADDAKLTVTAASVNAGS